MAGIPGEAGPGAGYPQWGTQLAGSIGPATGEVVEVSDALAKYWAEVSNVPVSLIWFTSQSAAQAYAQAHEPAAAQASKSVSSFKQSVANATTNKATAALSAPLAWTVSLAGAGGLLVRSIKVIIGGVLILSGIIRLTGADKTALGIAGKAAVFA